MSDYTRLCANLDSLRLSKIKECLPSYLDDSATRDLSFVGMLLQLTDREVESREKRAAETNIMLSSFPCRKTLDGFDFTYQPSISRAQVLDLASLRFLETCDNILLIGSSGVGKTHLATAIGIEASSRRVSTYFIHFQSLMAKIKKAVAENRAEHLVKNYSRYRLLIIDELGYLPVEKDYASVFFQLVASRYERRSTIITTNQPLSKWGEVFGDPVLANAIIDRLVHHSTIIKITGRSYRIKDKILDGDEKGRESLKGFGIGED